MKKALIGLMIGLLVMGTVASAADAALDAYDAAAALWVAGKHTDAVTAFKQLPQDYPDAKVGILVAAQSFIGQDYFWHQKAYIEAEAVFAGILTNFPAAHAQQKLTAQTYRGLSLEKLNRPAEANVAWMAGIEDSVSVLGATNEVKGVWSVFNKIQPQLIPAARYKEFLETVIRATKATEANAAFLGRVKSELEKMK